MLIHKLKQHSKDSKIAILGYGKEGKSSLKLLKKLGAKDITILDKKEISEREEGVRYQIGKDYLKNLDNFDLIIRSPGISPYINKLQKYMYKMTSSIHIFLDNYKGKVIGITGTKGKSTTSTLLYMSLQNAGYKVKIVGNIGNPVLDEIDVLENKKYDYVIFEMSSFMLEGGAPKLYIGYINNVYDCHLDWHKGKENYINAKLNIFKNSQHKIANIEIKNILQNRENITFFGNGTNFVYKQEDFYINGKTVLKDKDFILQGKHNRINITGILSILYTIFTDKKESNWIFSKLIYGLKQSLETFSGLPNRIQNIGTYKGIIFIDDAIATTPESTIAAIKTFEHKIGTLILGGEDSGFQFDALVNIIYKYKIKNIVLFPDTGEKVFGDLSSFKYESTFKYTLKDLEITICKTKSMDFAINFAYKNTSEGKICLLSTAAPSFSVWNSYLHKSKEFQKYVKKYSA